MALTRGRVPVGFFAVSGPGRARPGHGWTRLRFHFWLVLYADRGYDHEVYRDKVRRFQITPHLARRGTGHGSGLGVYRWVGEGAIELLHWFRRLRIRWEIRAHPRLRRHLPTTNAHLALSRSRAGDRPRGPARRVETHS